MPTTRKRVVHPPLAIQRMLMCPLRQSKQEIPPPEAINAAVKLMATARRKSAAIRIVESSCYSDFSNGYGAAGITKGIVGEYASAFAALPERHGCTFGAANFPLFLSRVEGTSMPP